MSKLTIPVQIDSIKRSPGYERTRCIYYRVEVEEGYIVRKTRYLLSASAFFAAGVSWAVLSGPDWVDEVNYPFFTSPELITQTMNSIYSSDKLSLELGYIWIPNRLFDEGFRGELVHEGDVYRLSMPYFLHCYRFVSEKITEESWLNPNKRFIKPIQPSPQETLAFRQWRQEQISISRERYHQPEYAQHRLSKKKEEL
jgi:hypothetical protein